MLFHEPHSTHPQFARIETIAESEDWIVVNKPAGIEAHPSKPNGRITLWDGLRKVLAYELANGGQVSLINRLDRETSGLTLVAKHRAAARDLCRQMEARALEKEYLAIVWGWPEADDWTVEAPIRRRGEFEPSAIHLMQAVHPEGASARTRFHVERRMLLETPAGDRFALIRALPETGRMHQIRVHLAHAGHPVVGDKIYGPDHSCYLEFIETGWTPALAGRLLLHRHALHSEVLRLPALGLVLQAPLPADMLQFLPPASLSARSLIEFARRTRVRIPIYPPMKVIAKCTNYSGCLVAYRGEKIELESDAPLVCPECGKPLTTGGEGSGAMLKIAAIAVGLLVVAAGGYFVMKQFKKSGGETAPPTGGELANTDIPPQGDDATPPVTPDQPPAPNPSPEPTSTPPTPDTTPPPPGPKPVTRADNTKVTKEVKDEVLERIDTMPDLSRGERDRLALSVQKARDMRRIVMVAFDSGQVALGNTQKGEVKKILDSAEVMKFRDDVTAVFVVLGFADSKGDDAKNLTISRARGKSVKDFVVSECGVKNVVHTIGMGSSTLIDENKLEKNRVAEIWAVLPP